MQEHVELTSLLTEVVEEACQVHQHVDGDDDRGVDGRNQDERGGERPVLRPQPEGEHDAHHELRYHCDVRGLVARVGMGEYAWQKADPAHRVPGPRGGVGRGVRVGDGRVGDGQEHNEPPRAPHGASEPVPRVPAAEGREPTELPGPEVHGGRVRREDVEDTDPHARIDHGELDVASRVSGLLGEGRGGLEPDERQDGVDRPGHYTAEPREVFRRGELGSEHGERVRAARLDDEPEGQRREHADLEQTEQRSRSRAEPDAEVPQQKHNDGREQRGGPPPLPVVPPELLVQGVGDEMPEDQEEQRGDEGFHDGVAPCHQEAYVRVESSGRVRVEAPRGREVLGELADRDRHEQASDQRQDDRERERAAGEAGPRDDREGDRRCRCHVRDGLEITGQTEVKAVVSTYGTS